MKSKELNQMLLDEYPELKNKFEEETSWQDGIDTGSTVVYEDVFVPFMLEHISSQNNDRIERDFKFIEKLAELSNDEYVKQVILLTIFDNLKFYDDKAEYKKWFGKKTLELLSKYNL